MVKADTREYIGGKKESLFQVKGQAKEEVHSGLGTSVPPVRVEIILLVVWLVGIGEY